MLCVLNKLIVYSFIFFNCIYVITCQSKICLLLCSILNVQEPSLITPPQPQDSNADRDSPVTGAPSRKVNTLSWFYHAVENQLTCCLYVITDLFDISVLIYHLLFVYSITQRSYMESSIQISDCDLSNEEKDDFVCISPSQKVWQDFTML